MFLLDKDDSLYRLPSAKFDQMLRDPTSCRFTRFAGARVRMTDVAVELLDRQPIRIVWIRFGFLTFDDEGYSDPPCVVPVSARNTTPEGRSLVAGARFSCSTIFRPGQEKPPLIRTRGLDDIPPAV